MKILENGNYLINFLDGSQKEFEALSEADLSEANLYRADLSEANLRGTYLEHNKYISSFTFGNHFCFFQIETKYLKIGCIGMQLEEWIEKFEEIGKKNRYNEKEIKAYGIIIKAIKEIYL